MVEFLPSLGEGETSLIKVTSLKMQDVREKNKIVTHPSQDTLPHIKRS